MEKIEKNSLTARAFEHMLKSASSDMIRMYGMYVIRNNITVDTDPMLADVKNVDIM